MEVSLFSTTLITTINTKIFIVVRVLSILVEFIIYSLRKFDENEARDKL